jgi:Raf kinase inhibitor-like YbhB/YbcL family protein
MTLQAERSGRDMRAIRIGSFSLAWPLCAFVFLNFSAPQSDSAEGQAPSVLQLRSSGFSDGGQIPVRYTCDGVSVSPNLEWQPSPARTRSFAIVVNDPDAPVDFSHWLVYNIPPGTRGLSDGASTTAAMPSGAEEGTNSFGRFGYSGPCPPSGKPHHYLFHLYALDTRLQSPAGATRTQLGSAIQHHIVAEGQVTAIYRRGIQ